MYQPGVQERGHSGSHDVQGRGTTWVHLELKKSVWGLSPEAFMFRWRQDEKETAKRNEMI